MSGKFPISLAASTSERMSPRRRYAALAVLVVAVLLLAIDGTVLYLAVPALVADLSPSATQVLWIGDIYSLALAGLLVTMGSVADRVGRKRLLLVGSSAFGLASLLAAFAPTAEALIAARFLLGVAGATIMPSTLSIIRDRFADPAGRTRAIAVWAGASAGGLALGPVLGGALLENFWWGSVFLINVPIVLVLVAAGAVLVPESRDPEPGRFDLVSAPLSITAVASLVYAVKRTVGSGVDEIALAALVVGSLALWAFVRRQRRVESPMIDVTLFRNPAFSGAVGANFFAIFALTGLLFFFSQYLQLARGLGPLAAGLTELPISIGSIAVVLVVAALVRHLGRGPSIAAGLLLAAAGLLALSAAAGNAHLFWVCLALLPVGVGVGVAMTLTTDAVVAAVPARKAGAASAVAETAYELGVTLGIAVLGSLTTVIYRASLPGSALEGGTADAVRDSLATAMNTLPEGSEVVAQAQAAFVGAIQGASFTAALLTAVAGLIAWRLIPAEGRVRASARATEEAVR